MKLAVNDWHQNIVVEFNLRAVRRAYASVMPLPESCICETVMGQHDLKASMWHDSTCVWYTEYTCSGKFSFKAHDSSMNSSN